MSKRQGQTFARHNRIFVSVLRCALYPRHDVIIVGRIMVERHIGSDLSDLGQGSAFFPG